MYVSSRGKWLGRYVPAALRSYPFILLHRNEQLTLCVDGDSDLIRSDNSGKPFFNANGEPSTEIKEILEFLRQVDGGTRQAQKLCAQLEECGVLESWQLSLQTDEGEKPLQYLYRTNEHALNHLDADQMVSLRDSGALKMAYSQLLSVGHFDQFNKLIELQAN